MKSFLSISVAVVAAMGLIAVKQAGSVAQTVPQSSRAVGQVTGVDPGFLSALEWRSVGPHRGGRSIAVVGDPKDPLVFYFGATHGGVWKTEDAGTYWRNVSDGFFKTSPVGAIDVSLSDPAVIYVGMGESLTRQDISPGDGVYKSTDSGKTWTQVGLKETRHIAKVRIHPTNPDIVYVAAAGDLFGTNPERGVFRTKDGGKNWQRILYKSDQAGAFDFAMDPTNANVLYASLNQLQRLPWDQASGGPDSGLYKSSDGGDTWTDITHRPGMPKGIVGKIGLAISPVRSSRVWALVEAHEGGLYRSDDGGENWQAVNHNRNLWRSAPSYMHVVADQRDLETVWVPAYDFLKSTDGGKTFASLPMPHGDHHALWIDPQNPKRMIEGSDGGATVTLNGGATWSTQHNQPTAELFGLAIDDQVPYRLYAAQNDNTHVSTPSRTDSGAIPWMDNERIPAGEGGETAVKPDGSVVYGADRAGIDRYDRRTGQAVTISVWPDDQFTFVPKDVKYRFYYTLPLLLSPHDSNVSVHRRQPGVSVHRRRQLVGDHQPGRLEQPPGQAGEDARRPPLDPVVVALLGVAGAVARGVTAAEGRGVGRHGRQHGAGDQGRRQGVGERFAEGYARVDDGRSDRGIAAHSRNGLPGSSPIQGQRPHTIFLQDYRLRSHVANDHERYPERGLRAHHPRRSGQARAPVRGHRHWCVRVV